MGDFGEVKVNDAARGGVRVRFHSWGWVNGVVVEMVGVGEAHAADSANGGSGFAVPRWLRCASPPSAPDVATGRLACR